MTDDGHGFVLFLPSENVENLERATTLKVHFKDLTCIKYRRDMYMTWDGLLGKPQFCAEQLRNP